MKILLLLLPLNLFAQDTLHVTKSAWYARALVIAPYTTGGSTQNIEAGKSFGVVDAGLCYGRTNTSSWDSTQFVMGKITMDNSQYSIFSNEFTIGAGRVFNSSTPLILECSYTIMVQATKNIGIGSVVGLYDFVGNKVQYNKSYFGIFLRCGLLRDMSGNLKKKLPVFHHHK